MTTNINTWCKTLVIASIVTPFFAVFAEAGTMSTACLRSDRKARSYSMCRCIQQVANRELTNREQKRSAKFFKDPALAEKTRMSDRSSDERFWKRYKSFGQTVAASCNNS